MAEQTITIIEARPKRLSARMFALWQYRGFFPFLFKEITMRKFRGTLLGFWWLLIRPLVTTVLAIFTFAYVVPIDSSGLPYAVFYFAGFITWNIFHTTIIFMPRTLGWMQSIMRRTYFPKLLVPIAGFGPPLIETALILGLFALTLIYYWATKGVFYLNVGWPMLWFLPSLLLALMFAVAIGMVLSVVVLFVRDVLFSVGYFAQIFMFLTPVLYPITFIPEHNRWIMYLLNPMAVVVETSRWSLTGIGSFNALYFTIAAAMILIIFALCVGFFLRAERYLGDEF